MFAVIVDRASDTGGIFVNVRCANWRVFHPVAFGMRTRIGIRWIGVFGIKLLSYNVCGSNCDLSHPNEACFVNKDGSYLRLHLLNSVIILPHLNICSETTE